MENALVPSWGGISLDFIRNYEFVKSGGDGVKLTNDSIQEINIANNAVSSRTIADNAVTSEKLADGNVETRHIAAGAVQRYHIAARAIQSIHLSNASINGQRIVDGSIDASKIASSAVTSEKIANANIFSFHLSDGSVTGDAIANSAILGRHLADATIQTDNIENSAITSLKLDNTSVTDDKIANGAVTSIKLANISVTSIKIANNAIKSVHLSNLVVEEVHLANNSVTTAKLADGAVSALKLADSSVTSIKIVSDAVSESKIQSEAIDTRHIAPGAIDGSKIANATIDTTKLATGAVTSDKLAENAVTTVKIANNAIDNTKIAPGAISEIHIADGAVTSNKIASGAVTSEKLANGSVTGSKLQSGAVTSDKLTDGAVTSSKMTVPATHLVYGTGNGWTSSPNLYYTTDNKLISMEGLGIGREPARGYTLDVSGNVRVADYLFVGTGSLPTAPSGSIRGAFYMNTSNPTIAIGNSTTSRATISYSSNRLEFSPDTGSRVLSIGQTGIGIGRNIPPLTGYVMRSAGNVHIANKLVIGNYTSIGTNSSMMPRAALEVCNTTTAELAISSSSNNALSMSMWMNRGTVDEWNPALIQVMDTGSNTGVIQFYTATSNTKANALCMNVSANAVELYSSMYLGTSDGNALAASAYSIGRGTGANSTELQIGIGSAGAFHIMNNNSQSLMYIDGTTGNVAFGKNSASSARFEIRSTTSNAGEMLFRTEASTGDYRIGIYDANATRAPRIEGSAGRGLEISTTATSGKLCFTNSTGFVIFESTSSGINVNVPLSVRSIMPNFMQIFSSIYGPSSNVLSLSILKTAIFNVPYKVIFRYAWSPSGSSNFFSGSLMVTPTRIGGVESLNIEPTSKNTDSTGALLWGVNEPDANNSVIYFQSFANSVGFYLYTTAGSRFSNVVSTPVGGTHVLRVRTMKLSFEAAA
jgi:hypothetical protein